MNRHRESVRKKDRRTDGQTDICTCTSARLRPQIKNLGDLCPTQIFKLKIVIFVEIWTHWYDYYSHWPENLQNEASCCFINLLNFSYKYLDNILSYCDRDKKYPPLCLLPAPLCTPLIPEGNHWAWGGIGIHGNFFDHFYKATHFVRDKI